VAKQHISPDAKAIMTDENPGYNFRLTRLRNVRHARIKHKDRVYVKGDVHTNTVESAFSLFKRGLTGAFHKVSLKHLQRYLDEFQFRFNNRKSQQT
jgi:transposase-like protein